MTAPLIVRIEDVRAVPLCTRGARRWFDGYGLDFRDFLINGIAAETLAALDDALANRVIAAAEARAAETRNDG